MLMEFNGNIFWLIVSMGIVLCLDYGIGFEDLLVNVDLVFYWLKNMGKDCFIFFFLDM